MNGHDSTMFFGGGFMWLFWILLIAIIFVAVKSVAGTGSRRNNNQKETPIEILEKRYANGDINKEEFEQRRKGLEFKDDGSA